MIRYLIIFIFSLFVIQGVDAQEFLNTSKNKVDKNGLRQGHWTVFDGNGNLKFEGNFKDNIPYGEFKYYYSTGRVKAISFIYNDGKESRTKTYHKNRKIMAVGKYLNKQKDSIWNYYSEYDGILLSTEIYKNNLKEGVWYVYYPNGDVNEEIHYKNDKKHGSWIQYFDSGQIKLKAEYVDGNIEGLMMVYFPDGGVNVSGTYKKGLKHGEWMYFNEKAENIKKEVFENGILISKTIYQYEEGNPEKQEVEKTAGSPQ